jgi:hypothetical protein
MATPLYVSFQEGNGCCWPFPACCLLAPFCYLEEASPPPPPSAILLGPIGLSGSQTEKEKKGNHASTYMGGGRDESAGWKEGRKKGRRERDKEGRSVNWERGTKSSRVDTYNHCVLPSIDNTNPNHTKMLLAQSKDKSSRKSAAYKHPTTMGTCVRTLKVRFHHHIFPTNLMTNSLTKTPHNKNVTHFCLVCQSEVSCKPKLVCYKLTKATLRASLSSSLLQKYDGGNAP